jgi:hypothetical protein
MTVKFGSIRLLPITIFTIGSLLAVKSAELVRAAVPTPDAAPLDRGTQKPDCLPVSSPAVAGARGTTVAGCRATPGH